MSKDEENVVTISIALKEKASAATRAKGISRGLNQTETSLFVRSVCLVLLLLVAGCYDPNRQAQFFPQSLPPPPLPGPANLEGISMTNEIAAELLRPAEAPYILGPGDRLEIEILGDPISRTLATVGPDGRIYYHLLPGIDVWGRTLSEAKTLIENGLAQYIRDQPQVSVSLRGVESRRVWLLGQFRAPGVYPIPSTMTLLEAISLAGGPASLAGNQQSNFAYSSEDLADLRRAFIVRRGRFIPVDFTRLIKGGDLSQNIYLEPDDFIYFPTAAGREVYVLGAVGTPRVIPYNDELTLVGALANAQSTAKDAYWTHVAVVRGSLSNPRIAIIDYRGILQGKGKDIRLEPQDIVFVPLHPYRDVKKYLNLILDTFVSSVAINEGSHAVLGSQSTATGVLIPLGVQPTPPPPAPAPAPR